MKITSRLADLAPSPTMAVMQKAQQLRGEGIDVIDLGPGEPDFATPEAIKESGLQAIREDFTKYTPAAGIQELRQAVAERYNREWEGGFTAANVVITCGAKHGIYNLCQAVFEAGDEVLLPVPYWVTFPPVIGISGARMREIPTRGEDGFLLHTEAVEKEMGAATRGLIVNTPNNPTGAVLPASSVEKLAQLGRERGLFLLFDETYDYFVYGDKSHTSLAAAVGSGDDFFAIVGSLSKTFSMTGWRIGFCVAHAELVAKLAALQSHQTGNPTSISQKAALRALQEGPALARGMKAEYERRRALVLAEVARLEGFSCVPPDGAFYLFVNVDDCMRQVGSSNSIEFAEFLINEARVAVVPGSAFGLEKHIRISYATSMERLKEAFRRIASALKRKSTPITEGG